MTLFERLFDPRCPHDADEIVTLKGGRICSACGRLLAPPLASGIVSADPAKPLPEPQADKEPTR